MAVTIENTEAQWRKEPEWEPSVIEMAGAKSLMPRFTCRRGSREVGSMADFGPGGCGQRRLANSLTSTRPATKPPMCAM